MCGVVVEKVVSGDQVEDVSVDDTWRRLKSDAGSVLIDVRSKAEWTFVGVPELSAIGKEPLLIEWQDYPGNRINPDFVTRVGEALDALGAGRSTELFFICRSGNRSRSAAQAMAAAGYTRCRNVAEGFEGPLDQHRHRGKLAGWKASGLPWVQF
jgi:rhodanese-related sulfurtransferase